VNKEGRKEGRRHGRKEVVGQFLSTKNKLQPSAQNPAVSKRKRGLDGA